MRRAFTDKIHVLLLFLFAKITDRLKSRIRFFIFTELVFHEVSVLIYHLKTHLLIETQSIQISEQIDAVAFAFIICDRALDELRRKALHTIVLIRHDRAELDIVFHDTVLHELHPVRGYIGDDLPIFHDGIGDVIIFEMPLHDPGFKIESEGLLC